MINDIYFAVRTLVKHKAFTITALLALTLGIGATTAIFSVVRNVVLRPLPFESPETLVQIHGTVAGRDEALNAADVEEFRTAGGSFQAIAGYGVGARYLQSANGLERVRTVDVERAFFSMLGVQPMAGRLFKADDLSGAAVAGEAFWRTRLSGDPSAIGRVLKVDGAAYTVIGVMPDSFQFPYGAASLLDGVASEARTDLWVLREPAPGQPRPGRLPFVTGRLKPPANLTAAQSELNLILKRIEAQSPNRPRQGMGVRIVPLDQAVVASPVRRSLYILFGAAGLVLLLACANVTNLFLVRLTMRTKEIAARVALGASPARLVRQFLTESLLLSLTGGVAGLALAWWATGQLMRLAAARMPRAHEAGMDWQVFAFSTALCVLTGTVFGLAPALSAMRKDTHAVLKEAAGHATMGIRQRRLRDGLVVAEVALAFVLGIGAILLVRELVRLKNTDTGMVTENVVTIHIGQQLTPALDRNQFYRIAERVRQLTGVREAGFIQVLPLQSWGWSANSQDFRLRGTPVTTGVSYSMELRYVTPGYFQAMGIPVKRGRGLTDADNRDAPAVILVNEALAQKQFGSDDPIGKETTRGTIVGIVGNVRQVNLDQPARPEVYYPIAQNWSQVGDLGTTLVVRTTVPPLTIVDAIRAGIREVNPNLAIFDIKTMDRVVADSLSDFLLYLSLMAVFASIALFLAATGTYGVISYIAASRIREFAIRIALGAGRSQVSQLVLGQALRLTVVGLGFGLLIALAARPLLQNLPVTVHAPDIATIVSAALVIGVAAVMACLIPSRRAAGADPMSVLRDE